MKDKIADLCEKIRLWGLSAMIMTLPFSKAMMEICIATMFIAWITQKALTGNWKIKHTSLNLPFLLFIATGLLSIVNSPYLYISLRGAFKIIKYAALYLMIIETVDTKKRFKNYIMLTMATSLIIGIDGLVQYFFGIDFIRHFDLQGGRVRAAFGNINGFGGYLIIVFSLAVSVLAWAAKGIRQKTAAGLLVGLLGTCVALTYSRGSYAGSIIAVVLQGCFKVKKILPIFVVIALLGAVFLPKNVFMRAKSIFLLQQSTYNERMDVWKGTLKMAKEHPIIGSGINTFFREYPKYRIDQREGSGHAHNCYLQILAETGILGLMAFLYLLASFFTSVMAFILKNRNNFDFYTGAVLGLLAGASGFLMQSFVDTDLYSLPLAVLFWSSVGFAVSAQYLKK